MLLWGCDDIAIQLDLGLACGRSVGNQVKAEEFGLLFEAFELTLLVLLEIIVFAEILVSAAMFDHIVENNEELMKTALSKAKSLFTKNQTVVNAIKLCSNHLGDKAYNDAYELEKISSSWYEFEDREQYIKDLKKKFEE